MTDLTIEYLPIRALKPYPRNARTHSKAQLKLIANSIREFGFTNPVLISDTREIVAGHGRVEAAKLIGLSRVPCCRLSHLSDAQRRAYILADNQLALKAGWDREILATELQALVDLDFEVELTGFSTAEVDLILHSEDERSRDTGPADALPAAGPLVTRPGDLWLLGDHRLLCGNSLERSAYDHVMGSEAADLVFTDPPYDIPIIGNVSGLGRIQHDEFAFASGEMSESEFIAFLTTFLTETARVCVDGCLLFVCMDWKHVFELSSAAREVGLACKNIIAWVKDNAGMGTLYRSRHELVFLLKAGEGAHTNTFELGQHGRYRTNVWEYAGVNTLKKGRLEELAMHPTVKPVELVADAIRDCSRRREVVLDPFSGSGTTIIACEKTGRRGRAVEYEPKYVDVGVRRWQAFTGKAARLAETGQTFEEVEAERTGATERTGSVEALEAAERAEAGEPTATARAA
ncbi:MAG TPA: site-specific DNA-methyltransferase [Microvirga sp.]|jgi:DNA modification methylase